jgi:predicted dehydrogenase
MNRRSFATRAALAGAAAATPYRLVAASDPPWRVAVIGHTGRGGYGHGLDEMWRSVPGCEVVGVADPDPAGLAATCRKLGGVPGFPDYRVMLREVRPDIVAVAPRHVDQHHDMCLAAVAAGARGIYIEKPFCRTPREADAIVAACAQARAPVRLAVAHRNRYHPVLPVIRKLLDDGQLGSVLELRGRGKEDHRGGALDAWVLGTHVFDLAAWIAGPPRACTALLYQGGAVCTRDHVRDGDEGVGPIAGDEVHGRYEMTSGLPFFFDSIKGKGEGSANFGLQIIGTRAVLDLRIDREPLAHLRRGHPFDPKADHHPWIPVSTGGVGVPEPIGDLAERVAGHRAAAEDLLDAIRNGRPPLCDAAAGATTVEMVCALFESHRLGGARVEIPLKTRENPLTLL